MKWLFNIFSSHPPQSTSDSNAGVLIPHPPKQLVGMPEKVYGYGDAFRKVTEINDKVYTQFVDRNMASMPAHHVKHLARWWKSVEDNLIDAGYDYLSEVSDCDDRATFAMALSRMIYRDVEASLLVLKLGVDMEEPALGIGAGVKHMTNAVYTNLGWYVVEFPTGQYCKLKNYPNPIWKVWSH